MYTEKRWSFDMDGRAIPLYAESRAPLWSWWMLAMVCAGALLGLWAAWSL